MTAPSFLSVCLNPTLQKTAILPCLRENEVNRSQKTYFDASGKGINVTRVLGQLGEQALHLTQAGGRHRDLFLELVAADRVAIDWVDSGSEIRFCYTLLSEERATATEIVEEGVTVSPGTEEKVTQAFDRLVPDHNIVIFSGTKAAGFSDALFPALVRTAKQQGACVILDVRHADLTCSLEHRPDVIKPNFAEFVATFLSTEMPSEHDEDPTLVEEAGQKMMELRRAYGSEVVLTRGIRSTLYTSHEGVLEAPVEPIRATNPIGSGDAFTAGLASVLGRGGTLSDAVRKGHECGRQNAACVRPGVIR